MKRGAYCIMPRRGDMKQLTADRSEFNRDISVLGPQWPMKFRNAHENNESIKFAVC